MKKETPKEEKITVELNGYPYNPVTERFEGLDEEKRAWVKDFYRAMGYALFLARQENDTSLRQGYILLDNVVEQFLKSYLRNIKKVPFNKDKVNFDSLISMAGENIEKSQEILQRILECHKTRNKLYHSSVYLSISKMRFLDYLDDVFSLCKLMGFANISDKVSEEYHTIIQDVYDKRNKERSRALSQIEDLIKDTFGISPGIYQGDILLGSVPGYSNPALDGIKTLLLGALRRGDVDGKKARILELIDSNEKDAFHSFFISHADSSTWYCFYNCVWSEWGEGDDYYIKQIYDLIKQNEDKIDHKIAHRRRGYFQGAFDSYFSG